MTVSPKTLASVCFSLLFLLPLLKCQVWEKAGSNGFLNVNIPEEHGGIGGDFKSAMIVHEEL